MDVKRKAATLELSQITPYPNNPRLNDSAVEAVIESMKQCGVVAPIIVDENHVILAGHTRYKALSEMGYEKADCVVVSGMNEDQKRKYRILDNKTAELAEWDDELLRGELEYLNLDGFRWFDEPEEKTSEKPAHDTTEAPEIRCPRCGALVEQETSKI